MPQIILHCLVGGSDYQEIRASSLDGLLLGFDDNRRQSFSVTIIDNLIVEDTESFTLQLRFDPFDLLPPSSVRLSPNVSVVTILDDDDDPGIVSSSIVYIDVQG